MIQGQTEASAMRAEITCMVQSKLRVGAANDPAEHEADRMAEIVVNGKTELAASAPPAEQGVGAGMYQKAIPVYPRVSRLFRVEEDGQLRRSGEEAELQRSEEEAELQRSEEEEAQLIAEEEVSLSPEPEIQEMAAPEIQPAAEAAAPVNPINVAPAPVLREAAEEAPEEEMQREELEPIREKAVDTTPPPPEISRSTLQREEEEAAAQLREQRPGQRSPRQPQSRLYHLRSHPPKNQKPRRQRPVTPA